MATKEQIIEILKTVNDPEIGMDVWSLGLIYEIKAEKDSAYIKMTFTTPMCPYGPALMDMVEYAIKEGHKEIKEVRIDIVFDPPWQPSEELKAMFGL